MGPTFPWLPPQECGLACNHYGKVIDAGSKAIKCETMDETQVVQLCDAQHESVCQAMVLLVTAQISHNFATK
jgi:hypothetical protein